jgi:hypothetical protein
MQSILIDPLEDLLEAEPGKPIPLPLVSVLEMIPKPLA